MGGAPGSLTVVQPHDHTGDRLDARPLPAGPDPRSGPPPAPLPSLAQALFGHGLQCPGEGRYARGAQQDVRLVVVLAEALQAVIGIVAQRRLSGYFVRINLPLRVFLRT